MASSLIVWSSLNYFPAHQPTTINFMHLHINFKHNFIPTSHIYITFLIVGIQPKICSRVFLAKIVDIIRPLPIFADKLHRECLTGF